MTARALAIPAHLVHAVSRRLALGIAAAADAGKGPDSSWNWAFDLALCGLAAGYRAQGLERERSDLDLDLLIHGPIVGFVVGF